MNNSNLRKAQKAKKDEFFTTLETIEDELPFYKDSFKDKTIYLNCDNPKTSNFFKYLVGKFDEWQIKKIIATYLTIDSEEPAYKVEVVR